MDQFSQPLFSPIPMGPVAPVRPIHGALRMTGETWISLATFALLLFLPQSHGASPYLLIGLYTVITILRPAESTRRMQGRWILFAPGFFALLSVAWSIEPITTLRLSLELIFTIYIGLWLAGSPRPGDVLAGLALAGMVYLLLALVLGQTVAVGLTPGQTAFSGFNSGKNLFGDIAAIGILAMVGLHFEIWMKRPIVTFLLLLALLAEVNAIILSQSAGAIVAGFGGCVVMVLMVVMGRVGPVVRAWLLILLALSALLALTAYLVAGDALMQALLAMFNKDPTLTGRQYLWARSEDIIAGHSVLGLGYSAFWVPGNIDAEGLWTWARIPARSGFNFHNTIIENLVEVGYVGVAVLGVTALVGTAGLLLRSMRHGETAAACWLAILAYECTRIPIEALGPLPFYHTTVLVWVAWGMAWPHAGHRKAEMARYD